MKKLRLDPGELRVQSFAVPEVDAAEGTVHGHATLRDSCGGRTCDTVICVCLVSQNPSQCSTGCC